MHLLTCQNCNKIFESKRFNAAFCSQACQKRKKRKNVRDNSSRSKKNEEKQLSPAEFHSFCQSIKENPDKHKKINVISVLKNDVIMESGYNKVDISQYEDLPYAKITSSEVYDFNCNLTVVETDFPRLLEIGMKDAIYRSINETGDGHIGVKKIYLIHLHPDNYFKDPSSKKSFILSWINKTFGDSKKFSTKYWAFIKTFKMAAFENGCVRGMSSVSTISYDSCYSIQSFGLVSVSPSDPEQLRCEKFRCHERYCLYCADMDRKKLSYEFIDILRQIILSNDGFPGFLQIVFTIPSESDDIPLNNPSVRKKLLNGIQSICRKIFALDDRDKRNNLGLRFSEHPIGSENVFRARWHCHVDIFPGILEKDEGFRWVFPKMIRNDSKIQHTEKDWKIDADWVLQEWNSVLSGVGIGAATYPEISFLPYNPKSWYWSEKKGLKMDGAGVWKNKKGDDFETCFWKKACHMIRYNMRSFQEDIAKSVVYSSSFHGAVIGKATVQELEFWTFAESDDYLVLWDWLKKHNRTRVRGFLQHIGKYAHILKIDVDTEPEKIEEEFLTASAGVYLHRRVAWSKKFRSYRLQKDERFDYQCPVTGEDKSYWNRKKKFVKYKDAYWKEDD